MAGTGHIGSIEISVMPDLDKFRDKLRVELAEIEKKEQLDLTANIRRINVDNDAISRAKQHIAGQFSNTLVELNNFRIDKKKAQETKKRLEREFDDVQMTVNADADTGLARAKLAALTRPRKVHVGTVFEDTGHVAEMLGAITGLKMVDKTTRLFRELGENIDKVSMLASGAYGAIGSLSGLLVGATGGVINFGGGLAKAAKAGAALPALLTSTAVGISAIGMALADTPERLKDYGDQFKDLKNTVSIEFWGEAEQPIRHMLNTLLPKLREEYKGVAKESGKLFGGLAEVVENSVTDKKLSRLFENTRKAISNSKQGVNDFANAIIDMGDHGAKYLPRLADWFTELGNRFNGFITKTTRDGRFDQWIEDGIAGLKDLGRVGKNLWDSWGGLYEASKNLTGGMSGLADQTGRFADMVNSPGFQHKMTIIFDGARAGAEGLRKGVEDAGVAIGNLSPQFAQFMTDTGNQFGKIISAAAQSLQSPEVQAGLQGFHDGFISVTNDIAGAFTDLEPLIGNVLGMFGKASEAVGGTLLGTLKIAQGVLNPILSGLQAVPNSAIVAAASFVMLRSHMDKINPLLQNIGTGFKNFGTQLNGFKALYNINTNLMGMSRAAGAVDAAMITLKGSAKGAGAALKAAFVENLPLLAITGLVTAISAISGASQEAEAQQRELKDTLDKVTGAVTEQTNAFIVNDPELANLRQKYLDIGGSADEFNQALLGNEDAIDKVNSQLLHFNENLPVSDQMLRIVTDGLKGFMGPLTGFFVPQLETSWQKAIKVKLGLDGMNQGLRDGQKEIRDANEQQKKLNGNLSESVNQLTLQVKAADEAADALRRYKGDAATTAEAEIAVKHAQEDLTNALQAGGEMVDWSTGKFNTFTDAGEQGVGAAKSFRDAMIDTADAAKQNGENVDVIRGKLETIRQQFINSIDPMHRNTEAANRLADAFGLIPGQIAVGVSMSTDEAMLKLNDLQMVINGANGTIKIDGNTVDAKAKLSEFITEVGSTPGTVKINGDDYPANMTFEELLVEIGKSEAMAKINGDTAQAIGEFNKFRDGVNNNKNTKAPVDADTKPAKNTVDKTKQEIEHDTYRPKIDLDRSPIPGTLQDIKNQVAWNPARMRIEADPSPLQSFIWGTAGRVVGTVYMAVQKFFSGWFADGGVVDFRKFDNGGEYHVAQIAPAGSYRLWAEPETGGEAYIPLAQSKRKRSTAILSDVADRFGYGLTSYADGGVNAGGGASGVTYNISCNIDAKDLRDLRDLSQFVNMLNLQMKMGVA